MMSGLRSLTVRIASLQEAFSKPGSVAPAVHVDGFQLARRSPQRRRRRPVPAQIADGVHAGLAVVLPLVHHALRLLYRAGRTLAPSVQLFMSEVRAVGGIASKSATIGVNTRPAWQAPARRRLTGGSLRQPSPLTSPLAH
jgi:hypothetical protein